MWLTARPYGWRVPSHGYRSRACTNRILWPGAHGATRDPMIERAPVALWSSVRLHDPLVKRTSVVQGAPVGGRRMPMPAPGVRPATGSRASPRLQRLHTHKAGAALHADAPRAILLCSTPSSDAPHAILLSDAAHRKGGGRGACIQGKESERSSLGCAGLERSLLGRAMLESSSNGCTANSLETVYVHTV